MANNGFCVVADCRPSTYMYLFVPVINVWLIAAALPDWRQKVLLRVTSNQFMYWNEIHVCTHVVVEIVIMMNETS